MEKLGVGASRGLALAAHTEPGMCRDPSGTARLSSFPALQQAQVPPELREGSCAAQSTLLGQEGSSGMLLRLRDEADAQGCCWCSGMRLMVWDEVDAQG